MEQLVTYIYDAVYASGSEMEGAGERARERHGVRAGECGLLAGGVGGAACALAGEGGLPDAMDMAQLVRWRRACWKCVGFGAESVGGGVWSGRN